MANASKLRSELNEHLDIGTKATHEIKHDNFNLGREAPTRASVTVFHAV